MTISYALDDTKPDGLGVRISVVVPCYNARRYIGAALRSVLAQQWPDLEVIVVDDGSNDGSAELVASEFPQVRLLRQPNGGVAAARNAGISAATGTWLAFLDADDVWLPGKLRAQWQALRDEPLARMSYTAWQVWDSADPEPAGEYLETVEAIAGDTVRWTGPSGWIYASLLPDCVVWTSTVLAHRSVFDEVGTFDVRMRIGEDWDLWLRASRVTPIVRVCRPLALYRMHSASITKGAPARNHKSIVITRALERWGYRSPDGSMASARKVARGLARSWADFAGAHLDAGDVPTACESAWKAVRADPSLVLGWIVLGKALLKGAGSRQRAR